MQSSGKGTFWVYSVRNHEARLSSNINPADFGSNSDPYRHQGVRAIYLSHDPAHYLVNGGRFPVGPCYQRKCSNPLKCQLAFPSANYNMGQLRSVRGDDDWRASTCGSPIHHASLMGTLLH